MSAWLAIVNPGSGQFNSSGFEKQWMPELQKLAGKVVLTDNEGTATRIARESADFDGIVVVGGDGTIFEVIAGMQRERQQLAAIPTGRGNCLARDLGVKTVADGFHALGNGSDITIDLVQAKISFADGRQTVYLSASTIALGYVVDVVDRASSFRAAGPYGYALATLLTIPGSFTVRLGTGNRHDKDRMCTGIVINNTVNLANFPAFRDAQLQDGLADLLILNVGWFRQTLHNLSVLTGLRIFDAGERSQARNIDLELTDPQTLMIDGQLLKNVVALSVQCISQALRCRKNP